jgi:hypothetical protein
VRLSNGHRRYSAATRLSLYVLVDGFNIELLLCEGGQFKLLSEQAVLGCIIKLISEQAVLGCVMCCIGGLTR